MIAERSHAAVDACGICIRSPRRDRFRHHAGAGPVGVRRVSGDRATEGLGGFGRMLMIKLEEAQVVPGARRVWSMHEHRLEQLPRIGLPAEPCIDDGQIVEQVRIRVTAPDGCFERVRSTRQIA